MVLLQRECRRIADDSKVVVRHYMYVHATVVRLEMRIWGSDRHVCSARTSIFLENTGQTEAFQVLGRVENRDHHWDSFVGGVVHVRPWYIHYWYARSTS